jgi:hypothetical protein
MIGKHKHTGIWWRASDPEKTLPGTLRIAKGEADLELLGNFGHKLISETPEQKAFDPFELEEPGRILGRSASGQSITLEGQSYGLAGDISSYRFPWVLVGKRFAENEEATFDEVAIEMSDLDTWTATSGFARPQLDSDQPDGGLSSLFHVGFERPPAIEIPLDDGEKITLDFLPSHSGWRAVTTEITISQKTVLRLRFPARRNLHEIAQRVGQLRNFFCLAIGRPVSVLSVTLFQDDYQHEDSEHHLPIQLLWEIPHNPEPTEKSRHPFQMPFTLPEPPQGISAVMKAWFAMQQRFEPVLNLYFGMRHHPDIYGDVRFLAYSQAVETYDRRCRGKKSSLDQRMAAVLNDCPTVSTKIVEAGGFTLDEFVTAFADSRNFYTHYNPRAKAQVARGVLLYVLTVQLQAIIEMSLFQQLGFSSEEIDTIFTTRTERYREIANAKSQVGDEHLMVPNE